MGLDNRDYARDNERGIQLQPPQTVVGRLILINLIVSVLDMLADGRISAVLALSTETLSRPWYGWQLLTYGFVHSPSNVLHLIFNMIALWFFGSEIETVYGKREFLLIYLTAIVVGGLAWLLSHLLPGSGSAYVLGASAAVTAVTVLFAFHFPQRIINMFGILPVPAWLLCTIFVVQDIFGAIGGRYGGGDRTAYVAHLGGAAFAFLYFRFSWNFGRAMPERFEMPSMSKMFGRGPKLKLHDPIDEPPPLSLEAEMDRILVKINATGFDSLSDEERRTLERASARFQKRRQ